MAAINRIFFILFWIITCSFLSSCFYFPLRVAGDELFPTARTAAPSALWMRSFCRQGRGGDKIVTQSYCQTVRRIQSFRIIFHSEHTFEHGSHLFLRRSAYARNGLFDSPGGVFEYGYLPVKRGGHRYTLCAAEFQHALYVLSEEGRFKGHLVRSIRFDKARYPFENMMQLCIGIGAGAPVRYPPWRYTTRCCPSLRAHRSPYGSSRGLSP